MLFFFFFGTKTSLYYGKTGIFFGLFVSGFALHGEALGGKGVESRWIMYFVTLSSSPYVWCHISYQSSILTYIFFGQSECKQVDNTPHWLCMCSKNPPKTGVTISTRVVRGLAKMGAAQQQVRGWWTASGGGCDLLHHILTGMPSKMTGQAERHLPFREKVRASEERPCHTGAWRWPLHLHRSNKNLLPKGASGSCGVSAVGKLPQGKWILSLVWWGFSQCWEQPFLVEYCPACQRTNPLRGIGSS